MIGKKILIVEDDKVNAFIIKEFIRKQGYEVLNILDSGPAVLEQIKSDPPNLILMDIKINGPYDGIETAIKVREINPIPIIYLSAFNDEMILNRAQKTEPYGYIVKPIEERTLHATIEMALYKYQAEQSELNFKKILQDTVTALATTLELRDPYTAGHQHRVAELASRIALEMNMDEETVEGIRIAGILHDIGKIKIPAEILANPARLSKIEFELIKQHSEIGYDLLKNISFPWPISDIVHQHHERINGSGYPQGLFNESIIIEARIVCVADVVEAMSSHRPYRPALGIQKALEEITINKGILYDPEVVDACLSLFQNQKFEF